MDNNSKKVWFVTGASKGFGLEFIKQLLEKGHAVAATSRSLQQLKEAAGADDANFLPLEMQIVDESSVAAAVKDTVERFGKIDVVVNNAGYGLSGALEELSDAEARKNFDVNVFGALNVIRHALPYLRKQGSGHIINISSIAGFSGGFPGFGIYCATKFALTGLTESLAVEVKPFGINVMQVLPGYFRTDFLTSDSFVTAQAPIQEYTEIREGEELHKNQINGNQPGDPEKGVAEIIKATEASQPPLYLFLGSDSVGMAEQKLNFLSNELQTWKAVSAGTDFALQD